MKKLILLLALIPFVSFARVKNAKLRFEPIYGLETSLIRYPEPSKYVTRATYGLRVLYGSSLLSTELEISQAKSQENYSSPTQKVEDTSNRAGLGLRSTTNIGPLLSAYLRAGGRATQGYSTISTDGDKETIDNPLRIDPYAGAGLVLSLTPYFGINAGITLVRNEENKFDSQYVLGLTGRIGN